jgi:PIN domain nuclease of toxin-antitoxin system
MRYLLDTHAILWCAQGNECVPSGVRAIIRDGECFYSVASLWEIAIKQSLGKLDTELSLSDLDEQCQLAGLRRIAIDIAHLERIKALPDVHRDPFDRLLVAQALEEELVVITCDGLIPRYPVQTIW